MKWPWWPWHHEPHAERFEDVMRELDEARHAVQEATIEFYQLVDEEATDG